MTLDKIYCEDCLETLSKIDDDSIDLVITSPPYNKGYWSKNEHFHHKKKIEYDGFNDCLSPEEYEKWQRTILDECIRVIKPTGSIWYNHIDILRKCLTIHPTYVYDYPLLQTIIWNRNTTPKIDNKHFFPTCEWLFWIKKDRGSSRPYFCKENADYRGVIWNIEPDRHSDHPAPFPIELPTNIIKCCSKEGDIVYDPFMGSGTVAKAARDLNRHFIGSELNPDYIIMAETKIEDNDATGED